MSNRVIPAGSINPNAQLAPGVLVLESLASGGIAGATSNSIGVVGTGTWGKVNSIVNCGSNKDYQTNFGGIEPYTVPNAYFDMGTFVAAGLLQGVSANYACVRVTDGTDVMAFSLLEDTNFTGGVLLTALYSGTTGNTLQASITTGAGVSSYNVNIGRPGYAAEIFSNIPAPDAPTFWANVISAINNGQSGVRGPSQLVVASPSHSINSITMTANGSGYSTATVSFTGGGGGLGAVATAVLGFAITAVPVTIAGSYATIPTLTPTIGSGAVLVPSLGVLTNVIATAQSGGGSYAPGDINTAVGGTFSPAATFTVTDTKVMSATVAAAGTGGTPGTQTVTGTTGTGTKFQASVTVSGGGAITAVLSITVAGDYTVNPTTLTAEPVTGGGLTGAQLSVKMGVLAYTVSNVGAYSVLPSNPVATTSSGSGTGFTVTINTWKLVSVAVSSGGGNFTPASVLNITGGGSTGGGAGTLTLAATGTVKAIVFNLPGDSSGHGYLSVPGVVITGDGSGAAATAVINNPVLPAATVPPNPFLFTGGTNGNTGVDGDDQIGVDGSNPTAMYVLRGSGVSLFALVGNSDSTTFVNQDSFAGQIGSQAILVGPPGQSPSDAIALKSSLGLADNSIIFMLGDWHYFLDTQNGGQVRLISPQGYYGGLMGNLSPEQSPLNKRVFTIGTQNSVEGITIGDQDEIAMQGNGIEYIDIPSAGGQYFGPQTGRSGGYDLTTNFVNIQRMANYIGLSIGKSGVIGAVIGDLQTPDEQQKARNLIDSFLVNLISTGQIKSRLVILNSDNNPNSRVVLGFMEAEVQVQLFSVIVVFLINLTVGTTTITSISPAP